MNCFPKIDTLVSVVIPTYNSEQFILEALNSVFNQTYENYEVIIIDDGSTDDTATALEPFADRIRYYFQRNQGLAVARNNGLEKTLGEFVTYLDADDIWLPDNLNIKTKVLFKHPETCGVFSDFSVFNEKGHILQCSRLRETRPSSLFSCPLHRFFRSTRYPPRRPCISSWRSLRLSQAQSQTCSLQFQ